LKNYNHLLVSKTGANSEDNNVNNFHLLAKFANRDVIVEELI